MGLLERHFAFHRAGTTWRTEALAGLTTFLTLSYILFVQPALMAEVGIPFDTGLFATCVASALASALMGLLANYPIALAPAMGHNFFFVFVACAPLAAGGLGLTWQQGLAAVFVSGTAFLVLALLRFRERIIAAIPDALKHAIAAGIGLLVALIGLEWGGIVKDHPVTLVTVGDLGGAATRLALFGLALTVALLVRRVRAALLLGIVATALLGMALGSVPVPGRFLAAPAPAFLLPELDFSGLIAAPGALDVLFVLFFLDLFDSVGTLVGVGSRAGLLVEGRLPRAGRALAADALGTIAGAALGTSTVTSYVESAAGVQEGGRTGLVALVVAALFLLALPFAPLLAVVGQGVEQGGATLHPVLAPALIVVGAMMARSAAAIPWDDPVEALPAFLAMILIPLSFSITEGIAFGCIGLSFARLAAGRLRQGDLLLHLLGALFLLRFLFLA